MALPSHLPPREIQPPASPWRALGPRIGAAVAVSLGLLLAVDHRSSGVVGAVGAVAVLTVIVAIEVPLILRSQRKRQERRLSSLPDGAFFACRGSMVSPGRGFPTVGDMRFEQQGIVFAPVRPGLSPVNVSWSTIARITLGPATTQPLAGALVLEMLDGSKRTFVVRAWSGLAEVLATGS